MGTPRIRFEANERVDLADMTYLADGMLSELAQGLQNTFLTNSAGQRAWILDGFEMSDPAPTQFRVDLGKAILSRRDEYTGIVSHGIVTAAGDALKIIDVSAYSPGVYGAYLKFEYVDGDSASRIFWNASGTGSEYAANINTRRNPNWAIRLELSSPGVEWLKLGEVTIIGGPSISAIDDQRLFYFEGAVEDDYPTGWSTDGGGGANDRDPDRAQYGVKDLRTFVAAMQQCIEDVKGRGLGRWWDPYIGGMDIGPSFGGDPIEEAIRVGDVNFGLNFNGISSVPQVNFDANDRLNYVRSTNIFNFVIGGATPFSVDASGIVVAAGAIIGFAGTPTADRVSVGDSTFYIEHGGGTAPIVNFDTNDFFRYTRASNTFDAVIGSASIFTIDTAKITAPTSVVTTSSATGPGTGLIGKRAVNNTITCCGRMDSGGGLSSGYSKWNVATATRSSLGQYAVTFSEALPTNPGISFAHATIAGPTAIQVDIYNQATTGFQVQTRDVETDAFVDLDFQFMTIGGGS